MSDRIKKIQSLASKEEIEGFEWGLGVSGQSLTDAEQQELAMQKATIELRDMRAQAKKR